MRALVVDDDESILEFVVWVLTDEGYDVVTAENGKVALDVVQHTRPDVILLDMRMPVMDGWQFAKAYRNNFVHPAPIIVVTAAQDARQRADEIRADAHLGKPFDVDDLLRIIDSFNTDGSGGPEY